MMDMNDFRYFVNIVEKGGFTAAGKALGMPTSTLSYRIKQLEEQLGLTLLVRSSRRFGVTEAGAEFYRYAGATVERADEAEFAMRNRVAESTHTIRYATTMTIAQFVMPEIISSFTLENSNLRLVEHAVDGGADSAAEWFDVAICERVDPLLDSGQIQETLGRMPWKLFASPKYLSQRGEPETPDDLPRHDTLFFRAQNAQPRWSLRHAQSGMPKEVVILPRLASTSGSCLKNATIAGAGITAMPAFACREELSSGRLKVVLPDWLASDSLLRAVISAPNRMRAGVTTFIDHVANAIAFSAQQSI